MGKKKSENLLDVIEEMYEDSDLPNIDDSDWELMKKFDPNLSDQ